jgi:translation initiation factor 5
MAKLSIDPTHRNDMFERYVMDIPILKSTCKNGGTIIWTNIQTVIRQLQCSEKDILSWFKKQLGTSIKSTNEGWKISTNVQSDKLLSFLDAFIIKYVLCKRCRNPESDSNNRCKACGHQN